MSGRGRRRWRVIGAAVMATALATDCSPAATTDLTLPPRPSTVDVVMREYRFEHAPQAAPGRMLFRARNLGTTAHELTMVRLRPDQSGTVQELVLSLQSLATVVILPERAPGGDDVFAADLVPGRYGFICFTRDADGVQHAARGMTSQLVVG